jgi:hypothetical protein
VIRKHPHRLGGRRFALRRLLGRGKEWRAFLRLRFHLFLETDLLLHRFLPGRGRRILLMLALVWVVERGFWGSSRAKGSVARSRQVCIYDCGSTAYSVGTVYRGKEHLYTPGVCPGLLATPRCFPPVITLCLTGDHLMPHWRSPCR